MPLIKNQKDQIDYITFKSMFQKIKPNGNHIFLWKVSGMN